MYSRGYGHQPIDKDAKEAAAHDGSNGSPSMAVPNASSLPMLPAILPRNSRASYHACGCAVPPLRPPPPPQRLRPFHRLPPRRTLPKRPSTSTAGARIKCANGSLRAMPTLSRILPPFESAIDGRALGLLTREDLLPSPRHDDGRPSGLAILRARDADLAAGRVQEPIVTRL